MVKAIFAVTVLLLAGCNSSRPVEAPADMKADMSRNVDQGLDAISKAPKQP